MHHLRAWFLREKRDFPWRRSSSPYAVWVSEVMLQQTRAAVVIPYFNSWMVHFPDIKSLASAPIEQVIKQWEGLGYYSRARNLHQGAQCILDHHGGVLPSTYTALRAIPGIGPYTANAILAFAFHRRAAPVDGNVLRVASRYFGLKADISKARTRQEIEHRLIEWLPQDRPWEVAEALIELGATVCGKTALCDQCPLQAGCAAYGQGDTKRLPIKSKKARVTLLHRVVGVVQADGHILLRKGQKGKVMADLYEFPYFEADGPWSAQQVTEALGIAARPVMALDEVHHTFTRFRVRLYPWLFEATGRAEIPGHSWVAENTLSTLPFSSGHRRLLQSILLPKL